MYKAERPIKPRKEWLYTSRPEVQKVYTTKEVAELLDVSEAIIRGIVQYHNLDQSIVSTKSSRVAIYSYDTVRQIKEIHEARLNKIKMSEQKRMLKEMQTDEDAQLHPLVTDKRCLKLSYWPDIVPNCFKECEE